MDISILPGYRHILDQVQAAWEEVQHLHTLRVIVLEGESGTYKTRLAETFLANSQLPAIRCRGVEIPETYLPLRMAFESILELAVVREQLERPTNQISSEWQMTLTALAQLLPWFPLVPTPMVEALAHWQPAFVEQSTGDSLDADKSLHPLTLPNLFAPALGELATQIPLVFLVDNLDLADDTTIEALTLNILPALKECAVLFIVALDQTNTPKTSLSEFIHWTESVPFGQRLTLAPLSVADIQAVMFEEGLELTAAQLPEVAAHIQRTTGGNLARVCDMVHWLKLQGSDALAAVTMAQDHMAVYQGQFAQLSEMEQTVLQVASVQGTLFCSQVTAQVFEKHNADIAAVLNQLEEKTALFVASDIETVFQESTLHWYHFRGRRIHDWIYATIPYEQRAGYHRQVGQALETLYNNAVASITGTLAQQFERGQVPEKAAHYYAEIAAQANDQGAIDHALEYAQRGLDLLANVQEYPTLECKLMLQKGRALMNSARSSLAEADFRHALEIAQAKAPQLEMESLYYLGEFLLNRDVWDEGMERVEEALKQAVEQKVWLLVVNGMEKLRSYYSKREQPEAFLGLCDRMIATIRPDPSSEARIILAEVLEDKAWLYHEKRQHSKTMETLQQAMAGLHATGSLSHFPEIRYKLHRLRAQSLRMSQNYAESLDEAERALKWARASRSRANIARAHDTKATTLRYMGRIAEGEQEYETALALLHTTSDLIALSEIEGSYGVFLSYTGNKRRARELYERSYAHRREINYLYKLQYSQNNLAAIDKNLGLFQSALNMYQQLYSDGLSQDNKSRQSLSLNHIGDIYRILGRIYEAERAHRQAIQFCEDIDNQGRKAITLRFLGQVFLCGWRLDEARHSLDEAERMNQDKKVTSRNRRFYNQIYLGRLALCEGNLPDSARWLESAIEILQDIEDQVWVGIGYLNLGLLLLVKGNAQEAISAAQSALEALSVSESWRVVEAHHLLARCYLADGDLEHAQSEIDLAQTGFMDLGLSHRVFQAESTELHIQKAQETRDWAQWQYLDPVYELREDFNYLGI